MNKPNGNGNDGDFLWCTYCGSLDHIDRDCPALDRIIHEKWVKIQKVLVDFDNLSRRGIKRP